MTRKDYIQLADMIRDIRDRIDENTSPQHVIDMVQVELGFLLQRDNPRFDAQRFYSRIEGK